MNRKSKFVNQNLIAVTILTITFLCTFSFNANAYEAAPQRGVAVVGEHSSPYFFVDGDPKVDSFPLLKTDAKVNIAGVSADVKVTQVYKNDGQRTLEAKYVFPLSVKSAIHAMKMTIGDRVIEADIQRKDKARQTYEAAKAAGKVTSLLEQKRPNVFEMNVANIMPGDTVEVEVSYTEIIVPVDSLYEFVYPTVVGPRFTGESGSADQSTGQTVSNAKGENWTASPYLHEGEDPTYSFDIRVELKTGIPLADVKVTTHDAHVEKTREDEAIAVLRSPDGKEGNRDFIMRYKLQGDKIQTGLLLYPGEEENFFLMMLEPPEKADINMVPPREYVFIVDVSGSMGGFPLNVSKALMNKIIGGLREKDYFNIMFFAGDSRTLFPKSQPATKQNIQKALSGVMNQRGGGGTMILNAMQNALALEKPEGMSRILVIATDGYVNVEKRVFDLMRDKLGDANFFSFGIGSSVNRYIIEGMARIGKGEPFVVTNHTEAEKAADKFIDYVRTPLLTDIKVSFDGFDAYDIEPPGMPDLFYKRPLVMFGKYRKATGKVSVKGHTVDGLYERSLTASTENEDQGNSALKFLWAREKIARLDDYGKVNVNVKEDVAALGLKYHLMTQYTSFVAVDKVVRETGEVVTVDQPLPLPKGVSDSAVGGRPQMKMSSITGVRGSSQGANRNFQPTMINPSVKKARPKPKASAAPMKHYVKSEPKSIPAPLPPPAHVVESKPVPKPVPTPPAPPVPEPALKPVEALEIPATAAMDMIVTSSEVVGDERFSQEEVLKEEVEAEELVDSEYEELDFYGDKDGNAAGLKGYIKRDDSLVLSKAPDEKRAEKKNIFGKPSVQVKSEKVPTGITLAEIEDLIKKTILDDLVKLSNSCGFYEMKVALKIKNGKVVSIDIKEHNNKKCGEEALTKVLNKLNFKASLSGAIELHIRLLLPRNKTDHT